MTEDITFIFIAERALRGAGVSPAVFRGATGIVNRRRDAGATKSRRHTRDVSDFVKKSVRLDNYCGL